MNVPNYKSAMCTRMKLIYWM